MDAYGRDGATCARCLETPFGYLALVEEAAPSFAETQMVGLVHLTRAAAFGIDARCFTQDVADAASELATQKDT